MNSIEISIWVGVTLLGITCAALCSGFETGMYSINRIRLNIRLAANDSSAKRLKRELDHSNRLLATLLIGVTVFGDLSAVGISSLLESTGISDTWVVVLNVLILTPILFIMGDAVPKELFRTGADRLTYILTPLVILLRWLFTLLLVLPLVVQCGKLAAKLVKGSSESGLETPRESIAALLKEGVQHGILSEAQTTMLDRALLLRDTRIRGEMIPWSKVRTIMTTWDRKQVTDLLSRASFSRYPVVDPSGRIVGTVDHINLCLNAGTPITSLMAPPVVLEPDASVRDGLMKLRAADAWLGIVMSAGRPVGVVTASDLIEPLVGSRVKAEKV
ncbi:MAG: DUF21 domain-containing protein [Pyrinomonadaceae bacterium]|nr:DUF21 domain-containing protein [Phycisphaerales bacterium]